MRIGVFGFSLLVAMCYSSSGLAFVDKEAVPQEEQIAKLDRIGRELASAVLHKNSEAILRYDRPDLIEPDRRLLQSKSDLYCYLFDASCITWKGKSVYEKLSGMKTIGVFANNWGRSADGRYSFLLVFYDQSKYSRSQVSSERFLCSHAAAVATWTFRYVDGSWQAAHPPFDAEVDALCSSE